MKDGGVASSHLFRERGVTVGVVCCRTGLSGENGAELNGEKIGASKEVPAENPITEPDTNQANNRFLSNS